MRNANPDLKSDRAAKAVNASPPPVYIKLSCKYDCSAIESGSRVSLFKNASAAMTVPATVSYPIMLANAVRARWVTYCSYTKLLPSLRLTSLSDQSTIRRDTSREFRKKSRRNDCRWSVLNALQYIGLSAKRPCG